MPSPKRCAFCVGMRDDAPHGLRRFDSRSAVAGNSQNALRVWLKTVRQAAMTPYAASQPEHVRAVLRAEAQNSWAWERRVQRCANRTSRGGARDRWGAERRGDHAQGGSDGGRGWVPSDTDRKSVV